MKKVLLLAAITMAAICARAQQVTHDKSGTVINIPITVNACCGQQTTKTSATKSKTKTQARKPPATTKAHEAKQDSAIASNTDRLDAIENDLYGTGGVHAQLNEQHNDVINLMSEQAKGYKPTPQVNYDYAVKKTWWQKHRVACFIGGAAVGSLTTYLLVKQPWQHSNMVSSTSSNTPSQTSQTTTTTTQQTGGQGTPTGP